MDGLTSEADKEVEKQLIEAIKGGDAAGLVKLLDSADDQQNVLQMPISMAQPTNHAFGKAATLLQLASYRPERTGETASVLLDRGVEVDIHSACGLGMTERMEEILSKNPAAVSHQVDTYFPTQYAIMAKQADSIDCLMEHGDDPNREMKKVSYFGWEDDIVASDYTPWRGFPSLKVSPDTAPT